MTFETMRRNAQAQQRRVILADPAALRECADRLERASLALQSGESVLCDLTPTVTVIFKPEAVYAASGMPSVFADPSIQIKTLPRVYADALTAEEKPE